MNVVRQETRTRGGIPRIFERERIIVEEPITENHDESIEGDDVNNVNGK
jgi:hypothetical protein